MSLRKRERKPINPQMSDAVRKSNFQIELYVHLYHHQLRQESIWKRTPPPPPTLWIKQSLKALLRKVMSAFQSFYDTLLGIGQCLTKVFFSVPRYPKYIGFLARHFGVPRFEEHTRRFLYDHLNPDAESLTSLAWMSSSTLAQPLHNASHQSLAPYSMRSVWNWRDASRNTSMLHQYSKRAFPSIIVCSSNVTLIKRDSVP